MIELKLPLKKRATKPNYQHMAWSSCLPFIDNKMSLLIHRPREVSTFNSLRKSHIAIKAFCGNTFCGTDKFTFLASLSESGKLLCERCEINAVIKGLPSAFELNGKHVHLGKVKAVRTCCKDK